jgi:hypothetical protein
MKAGDCCDQGKSEAAARRGPTGLEPVEAIENPLALGRRDPRTVVRHVERYVGPHTPPAHVHLRAGASVPQSVFHQIGQHLSQQRLIAVKLDRGSGRKAQCLPGFLRRRPEGIDHRGGDRRQIHRPERGPSRPVPAPDLPCRR